MVTQKMMLENVRMVKNIESGECSNRMCGYGMVEIVEEKSQDS